MQKVEKPEVGQILYSSWGYDQTNIDFYQIVRVSDKGTVWIQPMSKKSETVGWEQYSVVPGEVITQKESWNWVVKVNEDGSVYRDRVAEVFEVKPSRHKWHGDGVTLNSYSGAWVWDGKPKHETKYA